MVNEGVFIMQGGGFSSASKGAVRKFLIKTLSASVAPVDTYALLY
jgi:hypothetical protein